MPRTPLHNTFIVIGVILSSLIIYYLKNLETIGCACAMDYKRTYIMSYHIFSIFIGLLGIFINLDILRKHNVLQLIFGVISITNYVFTIQYVHQMKKENCNCSESVYRTMMYILSIIYFATIALLLFMIYFGGLFSSPGMLLVIFILIAYAAMNYPSISSPSSVKE
jgi:hypothetical protein